MQLSPFLPKVTAWGGEGGELDERGGGRWNKTPRRGRVGRH